MEKRLSKAYFLNPSHFSSLLLRDLLSLWSFIHSHPLHIAYLLFFYPYILQFLCFLSPLLFSTSLLLISLLTISSPCFEKAPNKGFFINACQTIFEALRASLDGDDEVGLFEPLALMASELEACMEPITVTYTGTSEREENHENFRPMSRAFAYNSEKDENSGVVGLDTARCGSMRREKEWKRTLACKLYEERQTVDGVEGMDLLWEVYEVDSGKVKVKTKKEKKMAKGEMERSEEEEEEDSDGQLCCLQALRFSTGKVNLGMRRLNSMRISKAIKGIGLFVRRERKIS